MKFIKIEYIESNGKCAECIHFNICKNEERKQNLITALKNLDFDVKPFKVLIKCPDYFSKNNNINIR